MATSASIQDAKSTASRLDFGLFHEFSRRPGLSYAEAFDESFELVDAAEAWGLDAVWLAELHVQPNRTVLASPLTIASAIGARTERIKIGTGVQVLPLVNPLRIAEDAATADQISHGRLIFGVGRSGLPRSYQAYGVPYTESRERFNEALAVIIKAWTEPTFSYEGVYHSYHNVSLSPQPFQQPHPPICIAASSFDTFATAGEAGYAILVAVRRGTLSELRPNLERYRAAYRAAGHPGDGQVYVRLPIYVGDNAVEALTEPEESIMGFYRNLGSRIEESASEAGAADVERRVEGGRRLQEVTYDEALRDKIVVGTPDMVAERLDSLQQELGLTGILAELNCGGQIPHERVMRCMRLICQEVMPAFRSSPGA
jgi:alkanesulfonate monooxygenase SsuD/methylene tetrahydromethanopterin reductase-like flavin-dependent oxidoreductase (luciferase family)